MSNINTFAITGNLTADPEVVNFPSGGSKTTLRVAVNGGYKDRQSGEFVEQVSYFDVEVPVQQASACVQYLAKGRPVAVMGWLQQQRWETAEGNRSRVILKASRVQFLGAAQQEGAVTTPAESTTELPVGADPLVPAGAVDDDIPF